MTEEREAGARIKINKLLEASGWRFEDGPEGKANIELEASVKFDPQGECFHHYP
jgi:type I restriction enzyme R subunit